MRTVGFILAAVFLSACSSLPPKTEAIHNALVTDAALRNAVAQCQTLGNEEYRLAAGEQAAWWQRNNQYVLGADYGLLQLNWDEMPKGSEQRRAVLAMQTLESIQADASDLSANWFGDYIETADCEKLFKQVTKGKLDLTKPKKQAELLESLYQSMQPVGDTAQSARSINSRYRKYGRSLFTVEKTLKDAGCSQPNIAMLRNSWPLEVYDAVCSQKDYLIVKCEWGQCNVQR